MLKLSSTNLSEMSTKMPPKSKRKRVGEIVDSVKRRIRSLSKSEPKPILTPDYNFTDRPRTRSTTVQLRKEEDARRKRAPLQQIRYEPEEESEEDEDLDLYRDPSPLPEYAQSQERLPDPVPAYQEWRDDGWPEPLRDDQEWSDTEPEHEEWPNRIPPPWPAYPAAELYLPELDPSRCEMCLKDGFDITILQNTESLYGTRICPVCVKSFNIGAEMLVEERTEECQACLDTLPLDQFPVITLQCEHPPRCCITCLPLYFTSTQSSRALEFPCPVGGCPLLLSFEDIQRLAPPEVFQRHDAGLQRAFLRELEDFVFCSRDGCGYGTQIPNRRDGAILRCEVCRTETCAMCEVTHEGVTCEQFRRGETASGVRSAENAAAEVWVRTHARNCPGCQRMGFRETGCNHITCLWCRTHYCWVCLAVYRRGAPDCRCGV